MLAAVDLDRKLCSMTREVGDIAADASLPAEMRSLHRQPMSEMPPEFPLRVGGSFAHRARENIRRADNRTVTLGPSARFFVGSVVAGHQCVLLLRPPPLTPPPRGRGTGRARGNACHSLPQPPHPGALLVTTALSHPHP